MIQQTSAGIIKTMSNSPMLKGAQAKYLGTKILDKAWGVYSGAMLSTLYFVTSDLTGIDRSVRGYTVRVWYPMLDVTMPVGGYAMYPNAAMANKAAKAAAESKQGALSVF